MQNTKVLIIGAGPTGLMMAAQLAIRKIPFRIIDKNEDHTTQSRALVVHARSLEIFEQMGIASQAIGLGQKARALNLFVKGKPALRVDLKNVGNNLTAFPFLLMLEQSQTESLLNDFIEKLGHRVERKTELIDFSQNNNGVTTTLQKVGNKEELVHADWIVGTDGAHSIVRHTLNIPFKGKEYEQSLFVLDCKTNIELPNDELSVIFTDNDFTGFFPLTNGRHRVIGTIPKELRTKEQITFEEINKDFSTRINMNVKLSDPNWISLYHSHHRVVSTFRLGRCFLAGDAAHIHSPIGAQGMNTGLQDVYNLAWKLALVIQGKAKDNLLDSYHEERIAIAKVLVKTTDQAFNFISSENFLLKTFRKYLLTIILRLITPIVQRKKSIRTFMFKTVSQIRIHYAESILSKENPKSTFKKKCTKTR